ncbi:MAG: outer membrane beta-barrel protein [Gammaproteobacteria bacterium]|nr:outer membrane beta-barrel protein [Gammaproteobacteria bacterium]
MKLLSVRAVFFAGAIFLTASSAAYADQSNADSFQSMKSAPNLHQGFYMSLNVLPPFAGGLYAGYLFTPNWGLEAGADYIWAPDFLAIDDVWMAHLDVKGIVPLSTRFELFGKLGVGYVQGSEEIEAIPPFLPAYTQTSGTLGLAFGGGIGFSFTPRWVATLEGSGMVFPKTSTLVGGIAAIPTIGIIHYFSG